MGKRISIRRRLLWKNDILFSEKEEYREREKHENFRIIFWKEKRKL